MLIRRCCQDHIPTKVYGLYGLKHHIVEMSLMRDTQTTGEERATQPIHWMLVG